MAKKKVGKPRREVTKHQLSRWQREKKRQHIILGLGIFIIVAVLGIVGVGWYINQYQPLHQTVIRVNGIEFDMKYYVEILKLNVMNQSTPYMPLLADNVVKNIEQNELIRQGALKLGVSVSDDAVNEELKSSDLPADDVYRDLVRSQMLIRKLQDEYFEQQVPVSVEQRYVMAMLLESEQQATEVRVRLENSENFTELADELSLDTLSETNKGDFGWHPKSILNELMETSVPVEYAFSSEVGKLSQPVYDEEINKVVGYWLLRVLDRNEEEEEAHVHAILLGSEEEAQKVRSRLEAGEDFATLAEELSQLTESKENGGDLGMLTPGGMGPAFDEFVFNPELELGRLSQPIRDETVATKGGYWLVKVVDKDDNRQIEEEDRDFLKVKALNEWVSSLWDDPENEVDDSYLGGERKAWAIKQATVN